MNVVSTMNTALNSLSTNKGRTALTSLGITIGIAAVIAMVSAGEGARSKIDDAFETIGPNLVVAFSGTMTRSGLRVGPMDGAFTMDDAQAIRRELKDMINGCSEVSQLPTIASSEAGGYPTALVGGNPDVFRIRRWNFRDGGPYNDEHLKRQDKVCVLGSTVANNLFPNTNPVGHTLRAAGHRFRVIGVLEPKGPAINGADQDDVIMVPIATLLRKVTGEDKSQVLLTEANSTDSVGALRERIVQLLRARHRIRPGQSDDFDVKTMQEYAGMATMFTATLSGLIFAIACISLVVGGIGIMNIMLVSVTERTREIGIRLAVGARSRDVMLQFLVESAILALVGGLVGITLGAAASALIARLADWRLSISLGSVLMAGLVSAAVGIFFGWYPARKASLLDPIEALRYE